MMTMKKKMVIIIVKNNCQRIKISESLCNKDATNIVMMTMNMNMMMIVTAKMAMMMTVTTKMKRMKAIMMTKVMKETMSVKAPQQCSPMPRSHSWPCSNIT